jgi:hypothetical protein
VVEETKFLNSLGLGSYSSLLRSFAIRTFQKKHNKFFFFFEGGDFIMVGIFIIVNPRIPSK